MKLLLSLAVAVLSLPAVAQVAGSPGALTPEQADAVKVADAFLKVHGADLNIPAGQTPSVELVQVLGPGRAIVHFQRQRVNGIPVEYADLALDITASGANTFDIHVDNPWVAISANPTPAVSEAAARAAIVGANLRFGPNIDKTVSDSDVGARGELVRTPIPDPATHSGYALAWKFDVLIKPDWPCRWLIDARTGKTLYYGWFRG